MTAGNLIVSDSLHICNSFSTHPYLLDSLVSNTLTTALLPGYKKCTKDECRDMAVSLPG